MNEECFICRKHPERRATFPWDASNEWEGAPRGGAEEIADVTGRIRASLGL